MNDEKPEPAGRLLGNIEETALALARKWDLIRSDGSIACVRGCGGKGSLPSLACIRCLTAAKAGR